MNILIGQRTGKDNSSISVIHISGNLDASTHRELQDKAVELIDGGAQNIVLDLSEVSFLGSAGLRVIHALTNKLHNEEDGPGKSKHVKLLNPSEDASKVIKTLGFDDYLEVYIDIDDAIRSF